MGVHCVAIDSTKDKLNSEIAYDWICIVKLL